ncbi:nucleoside diphosphate-linked moiety X motif 17-like [Eleutherodactylus coqui]|uniref:nucleoside diphosphate-linked moiety X motif 17-like n=1 Tax=Eleutherodactylus coqui TaxID=57060 RepID=UPI00346208C4
MEPAKRVLVYLRKQDSLLYCAKFLQDITGHYACGSHDRALVNCSLDDNRFIISDQPFSGSRMVELQRPASCPIKNLSADRAACVPEEIVSRGVDVGVAILLQSSNKRILLIRRSKELPVFPNVWGPPGGHVEDGEQLLDAGLRELQEETGLDLQGANLPWSILGLWESAFPPLLSRGLPIRHHIITFLLMSSNESHQELQEKLRPDEREVSACVWLDPEAVEWIVATREGAKDPGRKSFGLQTSVTITEVSGGSLTQKELALSTLLNTEPEAGEDGERIVAGTKNALELWLETLRQEEVDISSCA